MSIPRTHRAGRLTRTPDPSIVSRTAAGIRDNNSVRTETDSPLTRGDQSLSDTRMENITVTGEFPIQGRTLPYIDTDPHVRPGRVSVEAAGLV